MGILFMKNSCVNLQNELIKECIFVALMILMEEKCFYEITITEIAKKAGVSRMSYYRNYSSKEDIIISYLDRMFENYLKIISDYGKDDYYHRKYWFLICFKENERLVRNLIHHELTYLVLERMNKLADRVCKLTINEKSYLPDMDLQNVRFATGGLFNVILNWINSGMTVREEEIASILCGNPA